MKADGITYTAIVLDCHETEQHPEGIQKLPSNRINGEPVCMTEISTSTDKTLYFFKKTVETSESVWKYQTHEFSLENIL